MNCLERLAGLALLYVLCLAAFLNVVLACGGHIQAWQLPVSYLLFIGSVGAYRWHRGWRLTRWQLGLAVGLPLLFWAIAWGMHFAYDTSWDGQEYQQAGVIALAHGWNPWHSASLPFALPAGSIYVLGYPKALWLVQASIYTFTGHLQMAPVTNVVFASVAAILVFGTLKRIGISRAWSITLTVLAVLQIHFLQQLPTFMADGYSYQLALIAVAGGVMFLRDRTKGGPLLVLGCAWILLAGGKFSNLFVCALLGLAAVAYAWRSGQWRDRRLQVLAGVLAVAALLVLWVPYGTNTLRHHSPVYPQNQSKESAKLRFDNVPNNLKHASRPELLFYGIFSAPEVPGAGNPTSDQNVARLKLPFTFHRYEINEVNNFQGRVGSGGILFSGIFILSAMMGATIWMWRSALRTPHLLLGATLLVAAILIGALVIPVPNKLRYSPLVTLVPLVVTAVTAAAQKPPRWLRAMAALLVILVAVNTLVAAGALVSGRLKEGRAIQAQLHRLQASGVTYEVSATNFYAHYQRLEDAGVSIRPVPALSCEHPEALEASFGTTRLCPASR